jgi:folate-binding Fe-S cluster repair protein YgfZ
VAISYTKGCYLGQEVMARLKNLGQVRRHLHIVRGSGGPIPVGTALFKNESKVGEIRSTALDGDGFLAMAMLSLVQLGGAGSLSATSGGPATITIIRRV